MAASRRARGIHHLSNCSWATEARLRSHIPRRTLWQGLQECVGSAVQSRQTKAGHHWKRQKCRHASTIRSFCQESGQSRTCTVKKVQCQRNIYIIMSNQKKQKTKSIEYNANSTGWGGVALLKKKNWKEKEHFKGRTFCIHDLLCVICFVMPGWSGWRLVVLVVATVPADGCLEPPIKALVGVEV